MKACLRGKNKNNNKQTNKTKKNMEGMELAIHLLEKAISEQREMMGEHFLSVSKELDEFQKTLVLLKDRQDRHEDRIDLNYQKTHVFKNKYAEDKLKLNQLNTHLLTTIEHLDRDISKLDANLERVNLSLDKLESNLLITLIRDLDWKQVTIICVTALSFLAFQVVSIYNTQIKEREQIEELRILEKKILKHLEDADQTHQGEVTVSFSQLG